MKFRPCIDLHKGRVKQIVGASLSDDDSGLETNFVASHRPGYYAQLYYRDGLAGAHVIMLGPGNEAAAREALAAQPGFLQVGGGITPENAAEWLSAGAAQVIVTSYLFENGDFSPARLAALSAAVPPEKLVIDLSCRQLPDGGYAVACDRWQHLTSLRLTRETLAMLAAHCCEFLVHAVSVEGLQAGIDAELVQLLAEISPLPAVYAGGIHSQADIDLIEQIGRGKIDFTVGSALDLFGGTALKYDELKRYNGQQFPEYSHCELCPRRCGVNRAAGQLGFCREGAALHIASIGPHFGEEPPLVGTDGSGTIFLTGCSCGCFFCQNYQLSQEHLGEYLTVEAAAERILAVADQGVRNFNLVTPDHFWPHLREVIGLVKARGCELPWIWNSSGYSRVEILREAVDYVDIFLPDFKFAVPELAASCMGRPDYPAVAIEGLRFLVERMGFLRPFEAEGVMPASHGVLVRHLVLPGEIENSIAVLDLLREEFGEMLPLSVMRQFRPMPECRRRQQLDRMVSDEEYNAVLEHIRELGFRRVFTQPDSGDENFVPDFRHSHSPFKGNERVKEPQKK